MSVCFSTFETETKIQFSISNCFFYCIAYIANINLNKREKSHRYMCTYTSIYSSLIYILIYVLYTYTYSSVWILLKYYWIYPDWDGFVYILINISVCTNVWILIHLMYAQFIGVNAQLSILLNKFFEFLLLC